MRIPLFEADKKIALGVSCNNNTEEELIRSLDPWVDKVDYFIVVEGRYRCPYSPAMMKGPIPPKFGNTKEILDRHYGRDKLQYMEYYEEQCKKRQKYLDLAAAMDVDALIVWDTDEIIIGTTPLSEPLGISYDLDWNRFYRRIALAHEFAEGEAASLDMWCWIPNEELWPRQHNKEKTNTWRKYQRVHLNPGKQKYILNHYTFSYKDVTEYQMLEFSTNEENTTKWNPHQIYPMGIAEGVRFTTDRKLRSQEVNNYGDSQAWQLIQEETYRAYLVELQVRKMDEVYEQLYREPFTYYFDERGKPVNYTKEELELFQSLDL